MAEILTLSEISDHVQKFPMGLGDTDFYIVLRRGLKKKSSSNEKVVGSRSILCYLLSSAFNTFKSHGILTVNRRYLYMKKKKKKAQSRKDEF